MNEQPATDAEREKMRKAIEDRMKRTDAQVVEDYVKMMPPHVRAIMAEPLRPLLGALIQRERARCVDLLKAGVAFHKQRLRELEGAILGTIASNGNPEGLARQRPIIEAAITTMRSAARAIAAPPGSCKTCFGEKKVPSNLRLEGGQTPMVPCPDCVRSDAALATASAALAGGSEPGRG